MTQKTGLFLLLLIFLIACDTYEAASFDVQGDQAIMSGVIDRSTIDEVEILIEEHPEVRTIVMVNVEGSADDEANLVASRLIREAGLNTHVPADGLIASGGVDMFIAGVERTVDQGARVGVHSWADGDGREGKEISPNSPKHDPYLSYYEEMGVPDEFYWFTLDSAPADDMYYMTMSEMDEFDIVTE